MPRRRPHVSGLRQVELFLKHMCMAGLASALAIFASGIDRYLGLGLVKPPGVDPKSLEWAEQIVKAVPQTCPHRSGHGAHIIDQPSSMIWTIDTGISDSSLVRDGQRGVTRSMAMTGAQCYNCFYLKEIHTNILIHHYYFYSLSH